MKNILVSSVLLLPCYLVPTSYAASTGNELDLTNSICRVSVPSGNGRSKIYGSGVVIDSRSVGDGSSDAMFVLTCQHVIKNHREATCEFWIKGVKTSCQAKRIHIAQRSTGIDLALLQIERPQVIDPVVTGVQLPELWEYIQEDQLLIVGCPNAQLPELINGDVCRVVNIRLGPSDKHEDVLFHPQAELGRSGGGIFTPDGKLIGIVHSRNTGHGIAVTVDLIHEFLTESTVMEPMADNDDCPDGNCPELQQPESKSTPNRQRGLLGLLRILPR